MPRIYLATSYCLRPSSPTTATITLRLVGPSCLFGKLFTDSTVFSGFLKATEVTCVHSTRNLASECGSAWHMNGRNFQNFQLLRVSMGILGTLGSWGPGSESPGTQGSSTLGPGPGVPRTQDLMPTNPVLLFSPPNPLRSLPATMTSPATPVRPHASLHHPQSFTCSRYQPPPTTRCLIQVGHRTGRQDRHHRIHRRARPHFRVYRRDRPSRWWNRRRDGNRGE